MQPSENAIGIIYIQDCNADTYDYNPFTIIQQLFDVSGKYGNDCNTDCQHSSICYKTPVSSSK